MENVPCWHKRMAIIFTYGVRTSVRNTILQKKTVNTLDFFYFFATAKKAKQTTVTRK